MNGDHITLTIGDRVRYEIRGDECHEVTPAGRRQVSVYYALQRHARYRSTSQTTVMERKQNDLFWLGFLLLLGTSVVTALLLFARML